MSPVVDVIAKRGLNAWETEVYNLLSQEGSDDLDSVNQAIRKTLAIKQTQNPEGFARVKKLWNTVRWDAL